MIEFLLTPIGIWTGLMALAGAGFLVGAALSLMNSLWGESLAYFSAVATGALLVVGLPVTLALSAMGAALLVVCALYGIIFVLLALFALVMLGAESSRGY